VGGGVKNHAAYIDKVNRGNRAPSGNPALESPAAKRVNAWGDGNADKLVVEKSAIPDLFHTVADNYAEYTVAGKRAFAYRDNAVGDCYISKPVVKKRHTRQS
jgi:hypothetical protein